MTDRRPCLPADVELLQGLTKQMAGALMAPGYEGVGYRWRQFGQGGLDAILYDALVALESEMYEERTRDAR